LRTQEAATEQEPMLSRVSLLNTTRALFSQCHIRPTGTKLLSYPTISASYTTSATPSATTPPVQSASLEEIIAASIPSTINADLNTLNNTALAEVGFDDASTAVEEEPPKHHWLQLRKIPTVLATHFVRDTPVTLKPKKRFRKKLRFIKGNRNYDPHYLPTPGSKLYDYVQAKLEEFKELAETVKRKEQEQREYAARRDKVLAEASLRLGIELNRTEPEYTGKDVEVPEDYEVPSLRDEYYKKKKEQKAAKKINKK